jgi:hypothetical protein
MNDSVRLVSIDIPGFGFKTTSEVNIFMNDLLQKNLGKLETFDSNTIPKENYFTNDLDFSDTKKMSIFTKENPIQMFINRSYRAEPGQDQNGWFYLFEELYKDLNRRQFFYIPKDNKSKEEYDRQFHRLKTHLDNFQKKFDFKKNTNPVNTSTNEYEMSINPEINRVRINITKKALENSFEIINSFLELYDMTPLEKNDNTLKIVNYIISHNQLAGNITDYRLKFDPSNENANIFNKIYYVLNLLIYTGQSLGSPTVGKMNIIGGGSLLINNLDKQYFIQTDIISTIFDFKKNNIFYIDSIIIKDTSNEDIKKKICDLIYFKKLTDDFEGYDTRILTYIDFNELWDLINYAHNMIYNIIDRLFNIKYPDLPTNKINIIKCLGENLDIKPARLSKEGLVPFNNANGRILIDQSKLNIRNYMSNGENLLYYFDSENSALTKKCNKNLLLSEINNFIIDRELTQIDLNLFVVIHKNILAEYLQTLISVEQQSQFILNDGDIVMCIPKIDEQNNNMLLELRLYKYTDKYSNNNKSNQQKPDVVIKLRIGNNSKLFIFLLQVKNPYLVIYFICQPNSLNDSTLDMPLSIDGIEQANNIAYNLFVSNKSFVDKINNREQNILPVFISSFQENSILTATTLATKSYIGSKLANQKFVKLHIMYYIRTISRLLNNDQTISDIDKADQFRFFIIKLLNQINDVIDDNSRIFLENIIELSQKKNYKEFNFPNKLLQYYNFILKTNSRLFGELLTESENEHLPINTKYITILRCIQKLNYEELLGARLLDSNTYDFSGYNTRGIHRSVNDNPIITYNHLLKYYFDKYKDIDSELKSGCSTNLGIKKRVINFIIDNNISNSSIVLISDIKTILFFISPFINKKYNPLNNLEDPILVYKFLSNGEIYGFTVSKKKIRLTNFDLTELEDKYKVILDVLITRRVSIYFTSNNHLLNNKNLNDHYLSVEGIKIAGLLGRIIYFDEPTSNKFFVSSYDSASILTASTIALQNPVPNSIPPAILKLHIIKVIEALSLNIYYKKNPNFNKLENNNASKVEFYNNFLQIPNNVISQNPLNIKELLNKIFFVREENTLDFLLYVDSLFFLRQYMKDFNISGIEQFSEFTTLNNHNNHNSNNFVNLIPQIPQTTQFTPLRPRSIVLTKRPTRKPKFNGGSYKIKLTKKRNKKKETKKKKHKNLN